jgi:hypothetical protein
MSIFVVSSPLIYSSAKKRRRQDRQRYIKTLRRVLFFSGLFALLLAAHLAHSGVLWAEEDLPLAAGLRMFHGATLYREIWFDKPPLVPAIYLLWGARIGPALRIAGALYALLACVLAYALAATRYSRRAGYAAAALVGFFLTFDTHSAVLPLAADLLLLVPHLAAVLLTSRRQYFLGGAAAGIGFLFNAKGAIVLAVCALGAWPSVVPLLAGFAIPNLAAAGWLIGTGSVGSYLDQVWRWPAQYAGSPVVADPIWNGVVRTLNWLGFHAVLVIGLAMFWIQAAVKERWKSIAWIGLCFFGVVLGWRFFPRYYFLLLPALAIPAAGGLTMLRSRTALAIALLTMMVPLVRFGPRYVTLAWDLAHGRRSDWSDLALDQDSRDASAIALREAPRDGSLYVWGYRPEIYVYTGLRPATGFLDCQAMTGVPADRHLTQSTVVLTAGTHEAREELARSHPDVLIDSLSLYNPALAMDRYAELRGWLGGYRELARTKGSVIYVAVVAR